jgi:tetratricopeptide (TPR) repeat protein
MVLVLAFNPAQAQPPVDPVAEKLREAQTLMTAGKHEQALVHLEEAKKLGGRPVMVALNLAKAHAHLGNRDAAFAELQRASSFGLGALPPPFDTDKDLSTLEADARYAEFEKALDRNARPCEHDPVYRQFDYWLGTWDVRPSGAPPNTPPATNVITRIHGGCVILESWTAPGQTGQSFNIYDRVAGKWHQTWVDSTGGLHEYWGQLQDGNMVYEGDIPVPPNMGTGRMRTRLTFFRQPDGSVRQYSERTSDGGKTWQVNYDLIYTKRQ